MSARFIRRMIRLDALTASRQKVDDHTGADYGIDHGQFPIDAAPYNANSPAIADAHALLPVCYNGQGSPSPPRRIMPTPPNEEDMMF